MKRIALIVIVLAVLLIRFPASSWWTAEPTVVRAGMSESAGRTPEDRGRDVYYRYGCDRCHGADGKGGFANENSETEGRVPAVIWAKEGYTEHDLVEYLHHGNPDIGKENPEGPTPPYRMPAFGDLMSERETSDLVAFLFSLYPESEAETPSFR